MSSLLFSCPRASEQFSFLVMCLVMCSKETHDPSKALEIPLVDCSPGYDLPTAATLHLMTT